MTKKIADSYEHQIALIDPTKPIRCYRNLNRRLNGEAGFWSVKQGGTVKFHCRTIFLKNVTFLVNENGRQQVLATKQKTVHAYVVGYICTRPTYFTVGADCHEVTYNPYVNKKFVCRRGEVEAADICCLKKEEHITHSGPKIKMKVFGQNLLLTKPIGSGMIDTVPVYLL